jgi:hypothetical protein
LLCAHEDPLCPEKETAGLEFADRRRRAFADTRDVDRWHNVFFDASAGVHQFPKRHGRARQHDPTLGGSSSEIGIRATAARTNIPAAPDSQKFRKFRKFDSPIADSRLPNERSADSSVASPQLGLRRGSSCDQHDTVDLE